MKLYVIPTVTTKNMPKDTQKKMRTESSMTLQKKKKKNHQNLVRQKKRDKITTKTYRKQQNSKLSPSLSVITLNVNRVNFPIKKKDTE